MDSNVQKEHLVLENSNTMFVVILFFPSLKWHKTLSVKVIQEGLSECLPLTDSLVWPLCWYVLVLGSPVLWLFPCAAAFALPPGAFTYAGSQLCLFWCSLSLIWAAKAILCCWQKALEHSPNFCSRLVLVFSPFVPICTLNCLADVSVCLAGL